MHTLPSHIIIGPTNQIHSETHHSCESEEYAFMVLSEYSIIFPKLLAVDRSITNLARN